MINRILNISAVAMIAGALVVSSCTKNDNIDIPTSTENFVTESMDGLMDSTHCGKRSCYEFVWPVTIVFPDSTEAEVNSFAEMKEAIRSWKEANPDVDGRPHLSYPLEVMTKNGEIISVEGPAQMRRLRKICRRIKFIKKHRDAYCFRLKYPITVEFPGGDTTEFATPQELKQAVREWVKNVPPTDERPSFVYPITVILEDETEVEVADSEALQALKEECQDSE